jgi:hypothetical protein
VGRPRVAPPWDAGRWTTRLVTIGPRVGTLKAAQHYLPHGTTYRTVTAATSNGVPCWQVVIRSAWNFPVTSTDAPIGALDESTPIKRASTAPAGSVSTMQPDSTPSVMVPVRVVAVPLTPEEPVTGGRAVEAAAEPGTEGWVTGWDDTADAVSDTFVADGCVDEGDVDEGGVVDGGVVGEEDAQAARTAAATTTPATADTRCIRTRCT